MLSAVGRSKSNATDSETGLVMTKRRSFGGLSQNQPHTHISILCPFWQLTQISLFTVNGPCFKISKFKIYFYFVKPIIYIAALKISQ